MTDNAIVWSPIASGIRDRCAREGGLRLIICPFVQRDALSRFLDDVGFADGLQIITRWNSGDLASGVSDPRVYELCQDLDVPLWIHSKIHLKLITLESGSCFCGSANITNRGLAFGANPNVEAGVWAKFASNDWSHFFSLIHQSTRVTADTFEVALRYASQSVGHSGDAAPLDLYADSDCPFTIAVLPSVKHPELLLEYIQCRDQNLFGSDLYCLEGDLYQYARGVTTSETAMSVIEANFKSNEFVRSVVQQIIAAGEPGLRFGAVTQFIHQTCRDIPLPYRSEVKVSVQNLYVWLDYFFDEISWSVPGRWSQVIRWSDANT